MLCSATFLLVTCLGTLAAAIRVDWNTNKGPIVPATPRTTVHPLPPYREPAPVWEAQNNDVPNPNPYVYILPPPSRPRPGSNNYATSDPRQQPQRPAGGYYGSILLPNDIEAYIENGNGNVVGTLASKYIPNVGYRYTAVVQPQSQPQSGNSNNNNNNNAAGYNGNGSSSSSNSGGDKLQGKYNAKTKKYKAYEKVKYVVPLNYLQYPFLELALPAAKPYANDFNAAELILLQQLPLEQAPPSFRPKSASAHVAEAATELHSEVIATTTRNAAAVAATTKTGGTNTSSTTATTAKTQTAHAQLHAKQPVKPNKPSGKSAAAPTKGSGQQSVNAIHRR